MVCLPRISSNTPPGVKRTSCLSANTTPGSGWTSPFSSLGGPVIQPPWQIAGFGMKNTPEGHAELLDATAQAEDRHAPVDTGLCHGQRHRVPFPVIGFVARVRIDIETGRMNVGAGSGEEDSVNGVNQRGHIGDVGCSGEHQRQGAGDLRHGGKILLPCHLGHVVITEEMPGADDADERSLHRWVWFLPAAPWVRRRRKRGS